MPRIPRLRWIKVLAYTRRGMTAQEIGNALGVSKATVDAMRKTAGVRAGHHKGKNTPGQRMKLPGLNTASEFMLDPEACLELELEEESRVIPKSTESLGTVVEKYA